MFHFIFLHIYEVYSKGIARKLVSRKVEGTTDISISRVDFSSDGASRTRRVVTTRQLVNSSTFSGGLTTSTIFTHARFFLSLSPTDISHSRVNFSSDRSSRTRRVVTTRQHFQVSSLPPLFQKTISCYLTFENITTRLPLDGSF